MMLTMERKMGDGVKQKKTRTDEFTERAIMSLVMEAAELKETAMRLIVVVAALALAHGISIDI